MSVYSQAVGVSASQMEDRVKTKGELDEKKAESDIFKVDKVEEIQDDLEESASIFGKGANWATFFSTIATVALGITNPFLAAAIIGGTRYGAGKIAEHQASQFLKGGKSGSRYGQGSKQDIKDEFAKSTLQSAIMSGAMAGVGASAMKSGGLEGGGETVTPGNQMPPSTKLGGTTGWNVTGGPPSVTTPPTQTLNVASTYNPLKSGFYDSFNLGFGENIGTMYKGFSGTSGLMTSGIQAGKSIWDAYEQDYDG